jgi:hypothetical protein
MSSYEVHPSILAAVKHDISSNQSSKVPSLSLPQLTGSLSDISERLVMIGSRLGDTCSYLYGVTPPHATPEPDTKDYELGVMAANTLQVTRILHAVCRIEDLISTIQSRL